MLLLLGTVSVAALMFLVLRAVTSVPLTPVHAWATETVTPPGAVPRNLTPERVARGPVLTQAILLAVEMARADGEISPQEVAAIRDFLWNHVPEVDAPQTEQILRDGLKNVPTPASVAAAAETIRAIASEAQRELVLRLFVHVAQSDGSIHAGEVAFMERVADALGLDASAVDAVLAFEM